VEQAHVRAREHDAQLLGGADGVGDLDLPVVQGGLPAPPRRAKPVEPPPPPASRAGDVLLLLNARTDDEGLAARADLVPEAREAALRPRLPS